MAIANNNCVGAVRARPNGQCQREAPPAASAA